MAAAWKSLYGLRCVAECFNVLVPEKLTQVLRKDQVLRKMGLSMSLEKGTFYLTYPFLLLE